MKQRIVKARNEGSVLEATTAFSVRTHDVRMVTWANRRWFIAMDVARALGYARVGAMQLHIALAHQEVLALRLPEGELDVLVLSEAGLQSVLMRRQGASAAELRAKLAVLPPNETPAAATRRNTTSNERDIATNTPTPARHARRGQ